MKKLQSLLFLSLLFSLVSNTVYGFGGKRPKDLKEIDLPKEVLREDPYLLKTHELQQSSPTHLLNLRLINHGIKNSAEELNKMIQAAEAIYSQCPGVNLRIQVSEEIETEKTRLSEQLMILEPGVLSGLSRSFFDFFKPWKETPKRVQGSIDLHLVDYLLKTSREEYESTGKIHYMKIGQTFNEKTINLLHPASPGLEDLGEPSEFSGNSVILAFKAWRQNNTQMTIYYKDKSTDSRGKLLKNAIVRYRVVSSNWTLLAHELGHILLNVPQDLEDYKFHYCPDKGDFCDLDNLMSPGGDPAEEYLHPTENKVIGWTALPQLEPGQCALFESHPQVERINSFLSF